MYDTKEINIATCKSRTSKIYSQERWTWKKLRDRLSDFRRTGETFAEFMAMPKDRQAEIKDVGGFVGGVLEGGVRKRDTVRSRSFIALDLDFVSPQLIDDWDLIGDPGFELCVYSTHKHTEAKPKLRVIVPLARDVDPEEYEYLARRFARDSIDETMEMLDDTTYQASRMMFWPSCSTDAEPVFRYYPGKLYDPDEVFQAYPEWIDTATWPHADREDVVIRKELKKLGDPRKKDGWVGAFCTTYTVTEAIAKFLPDIYIPTDRADRYTYAEGSAAGGLVIYDDDTHAYSNHSTDPANIGHGCNAFDLVRIHLFGDRDAEARPGTTSANMPSFKAMISMLQDDGETKRTMLKIKQAERDEDFGDEFSAVQTDTEDDGKWLDELSILKNGSLAPTIANASIILRNDPLLKDRIAYDDFEKLIVILKEVPWRKAVRGERAFSDADESSLRLYLERRYKYQGKASLADAVMDMTHDKKVHPIRDKLKSLVWDGVPRAETIFIDYLNAEDTPYVREVTRVFLRAAVMRILSPGIKFDYMPILIGEQGVGKSTIVQKLGMGYANDSLANFKGKEAMELIQGTWIMEVGELAALRKSEVEDIKQFLSSKEDKFRPAYGRRPAIYPRQCVFIGTSNKKEIFRDMTGNRRFWPIDLRGKDEEKKRRFFEEFDDDLVDQIWAEVMTWTDQKLILSYEVEKEAERQQEEHMEVNYKADMIRAYLDTPLPADWEDMDILDRRQYLNDQKAIEEKGVMERLKVCSAEIMNEVFDMPAHKISNYEVKEVNDIMRSFKDWEARPGLRFYSPYKRGRGFMKKATTDDNKVTTK